MVIIFAKGLKDKGIIELSFFISTKRNRILQVGGVAWVYHIKILKMLILIKIQYYLIVYFNENNN